MNDESSPNTVASTDGQLSEILLVLDKEKKKIQAVTGVDKDGKLSTVDVNKKNQNQFMRVDLRGDVFTNFFSNFFRQLKDPTRFTFFKVPVATAIETAKTMQKQVDNPEGKNEKILSDHEVKPENTDKKQEQQNSNTMETAQKTQNATANEEKSEYRYKPEQIDWETMSNLGLSKEKLEAKKLLDPLLKGYKTNDVVPVSLNLGSAIVRLDARLSLQENAEGKLVVAIHGIRKEPNLNYPFFGHEFSQEDKDNLLKTGNMGRIVELTNPKTNEKHPSIISVDRLTKELVALRADWMKVPDEMKGVKLTDEQKQTLLEGKPLFLQGMISKKGEPFDAPVQYNADKRYVEFLFDRSERNQLTGTQQEQNQVREAPRIFRGKELNEKQYQDLKDGQIVYVDGLVDKKQKPYQGYIIYNKETGVTKFDFNNPDKLKAQAKPVEANKTQVAVNSEGKTNEATKNINEPLKSGQQAPDSKAQQEKQQNPNKSKGRKI
jgi:hypothetical protein